ncbi:MAG: tyrosine-protein phosphatase [Terriglobales bacterium]
MPTEPDPMPGWVDTHLHLLPGLDDGPADLEQALALAEAIIAEGTTRVVATPHANYRYDYVPERAAALREQLQAAVGERLQILPGCELHLSFENLQHALASPSVYSLNRSRYLLVEFPEFFDRTALRGALEQCLQQGIVPVLAHPERNPVFQQFPASLDEYLRLGCLSQVTASSFTGRFGKRAQQFSNELLAGERIHVVATDAHSAQQRPPHFRRAHALIAKQAGEEIADALCRGNPLAITQDQPLPYEPRPTEKKKSFFARLRG